MRIEIGRRAPKAVQQLMYVGEDGLPPPVASGKGAIVLAIAAAVILLVAGKKR